MGSRMYVFLSRPRLRNICYCSASAAGVSEENFSDFGDVHLENSVWYPRRKARSVQDTLKRLDGVGYPLRSNERVEPNPSDTWRGS